MNQTNRKERTPYEKKLFWRKARMYAVWALTFIACLIVSCSAFNKRFLEVNDPQVKGAYVQIAKLLPTLEANEASLYGTYALLSQSREEAKKMDITTLITFNMYVASIQSPIRRLTNFTELFTQGMAGFTRFSEIMHEPPAIEDKPDAIHPLTVHGDIEFKDVTFAYNSDTPTVLSHINLHIPSGKMLAIVGPSGSGKTTLCQLIPRFYEISDGEILLDGMDIRDIALHDLRSSIGIVQQDVFLFAGTIMDNIRYGKMDATLDEVIQAAKFAEIHDDILEMPNGYDTEVGERGIKLSGGQKQRISIARVFLLDPRILILDEATSALDTTTERKIQSAFNRLYENRTTLVIAHRLSTIKNADEIIVIDDKGIHEQGTHQELILQGGIYAELVKNTD